MAVINNMTVDYGKIVKQLTSQIDVTNVLLPQKTIQSRAIWDTGATGSVVTKSLAQSLELKPIGKGLSTGVHGTKEVNVYAVQITLQHKDVSIVVQVTECDELSPDQSIGVLIGMDIIGKGDFAVSNYEGRTKMTFRIPSVQHFDFVRQMPTGRTITKDKTQRPNDRCACGSGKKFKSCCGALQKH